MNNAIKYTFIFILGAGTGYLVANNILKKKYEQITQDEINSVKEVFSAKKEKTEEKEDDGDNPQTTARLLKPDICEMTSKLGYTAQTTGDDDEDPYVISPEEFGDPDGYDTISLTYYADKILANEQDEIIDISLIGRDSLTHFGEYEDDSVYVRNNQLKCDFEILLDQRTYEETVHSEPHPGW